jgi:hypothetical protein
MQVNGGDYRLTIGEGKDHPYPVYLITNKITGVVEYETRLLPQAITILNQLAVSVDTESVWDYAE